MRRNKDVSDDYDNDEGSSGYEYMFASYNMMSYVLYKMRHQSQRDGYYWMASPQLTCSPMRSS